MASSDRIAAHAPEPPPVAETTRTETARTEQAQGESAAGSAQDGASWSPADAEAMYGLPGWALGYFRVNARGHVEVVPRPDTDPDASIDLADVLGGLRERGITPPVLIRLPDVIEHRMRAVRAAFDRAIDREDYRGGYHCVYPIKVNQQRHVVEHIRNACAELGFGLEAGSKPELLAVLGLTADLPDAAARDSMPIICNGFKDDEFVETTVLARKLGRRIIPVVENAGELSRIIAQAERYGVRPELGVRVEASAGASGRSKFGLHAGELLDALETLRAHGMADCLKLVHCHAGSQLYEIRRIKGVVSELARTYCELRRLGAGLEFIDVGGGLGVDYDGSRSAWASSADYSLEEYAGDVVYRVRAACDDAGQPHPTIITESGRAITAHGSVLVFDVIGRCGIDPPEIHGPPGGDPKALLEAHRRGGEEPPQPVLDLLDAYETAAGSSGNAADAAQAYHDAAQARGEMHSLFNLGYCSLPMRAAGERLYSGVARRVLETARSGDHPELSDLMGELPRSMADIYFCNLSIFQSLPDAWAIDQLFPCLPIHRLDTEPNRRAVLADITCDSDGALQRFASADQREAKPTLEVHELDLAPDGTMASGYHMGLFLVGAYQEVLGDLHNLFGDTHAVHVSIDNQAGWRIDEVVEGDTVAEVLSYVQYDTSSLRGAVRRDAEQAVRRGRLSVPESRSLLGFYDGGLAGYTYLE